MANRFNEDEKNERAIRSILKLDSNRRCINCNSLGPQYVCTNFWTFVCTNCSGIHREFTHRVKSVSMAKFTSQEVTALKEGGNQRARDIYFKEWDARHHSFPDSSNVDRLRDFIKHVYVDRRFTGDRTSDKPPKGDKDDSYENRRLEEYQGGSKSPPVINDRRCEDRRVSDGDYKVESQSPEQARDLGSSSPPLVRPVRDILGENVVPLRISGLPKPNGGKLADDSALMQRTASFGSLVSSNESQTDIKLETTTSLIDFDADPEPIAPTVPRPQQTSVPQSVLQPGNSGDDNWASFDVASEAKANSNLNPLESVLSQLSVPAFLPSHAPSHVPSVLTGQEHSSTPMPHPYHHASKAANEAFNSVASQPSAVEVKPNGRRELPEDLFNVKHSSFSAPVQGWQMGLPQGMGISMHYNNSPVPNFPQSSRSTNPFDASSKPSPDQAASFPSISSLQGMLPSVSPPLPTQTPSLSSPLYAWSPPLPPPSGTVYSSNMGYYAWNPPLPPPLGSVDPSSLGNPTHTSTPQTHASASGPGSYVGQQTATNIPFPRKEVGNFGIEGDIFSLSNPDQQLTNRPSNTLTSKPFTNGGNPFG